MQNTQGTLAGSRVDWISQHTALADYFRKRFYETHNLFPQFAPELGGGQNIYNFAYYGLYDPFYLLSWLFPFLPMELWFQMVGVIKHLLDGILCFIWLKRHTGERESAVGSLMLMFSAPVVYHTFTQVMFVNYLPFFLLMLIGSDVRSTTGKGGILTAGTAGMILTSFYFAPACMLSLGIWIFTGCKKKGVPFKKFAEKVSYQAAPVLLGILFSLFYLVPVLGALAAGKRGGNGISWIRLFFPDIHVYKYLYNPYGLGLTAMAAVIFCTWFFAGKCRERAMAIVMMAVFALPAFLWLLNGGLYARSKVLIPFLPLVSFLGARFWEKLKAQKCRPFSRKTLAAGYMTGAAFLILGSRSLSKKEEGFLILADILLCGTAILLSSADIQSLYRRRCNLTVMVTMGSMFAVCTVLLWGSANLRVTGQELTELHSQDKTEAVKSVLAEEKQEIRLEVRGVGAYQKENQNRILASGQNLTTCYSSFENAAYTEFRKSIGLVQSTRNCLMQDAQDNALFLRFMGVKYLIGGEGLPGWEKIKKSGILSVYKNDRVAPLFYLTDQTIPAEKFEKMSWQEKQLSLLEAAAVPERTGGEEMLQEQWRNEEGEQEVNDTPAEEVTAEKITVQETQNESGSVAQKGDGAQIKARREQTTVFWMENEFQNGDFVFLSFRIKNHRPEKDVSVAVNGVKNKLSSRNTEYYNGNQVFHYTFSMPESGRKLTVRFGSGNYEIQQLSCWVGRVNEEKNKTLYAKPADLQRNGSGNGYEGKILSEGCQWLITSIPYDKNFMVYVDGKPVETAKVNGGFVGALIPEGEHQIEIYYQAPGSRAGAAFSSVAVLVFCIWKNRHRFTG